MRRAFTLICLALLGGLLWIAAPAMSTGPWSPDPVEFALRVPLRAAASDAGRTLTTPVLTPAKRFDLLGVRWSSATRPRIDVRTQRDGGRWSAWQRLDTAGGDSPDGAALRASAPLWVGGADRLQLRLSRPVAALRVSFVNATGTATPSDRMRNAIRGFVHSAVAGLFATPVASAAPSAPAIIPRSQWDPENRCKPRAAASYGRVDMAFVHHTETANDYAASDSKAIVLAICLFHRDSNGWNDIGYNFLADRYGQVFEGRAGGITRAVIGAQAQGYNSFSTGVSILGSFQTAAAPDAALRAVARLLAWKLALHGDPVEGHITETSLGGPLNAHPSGERVVFNRIAGHRDGDATDCPGDALYAQLPRLRALAANYKGAGGALTQLTAVAHDPLIPYLTKARLEGTLRFGDGASTSGRLLAIEQRGSSGRWSRVTTARVARSGAWSVDLALTHDTVFRVRYGGDRLHPRASSPPLTVQVLPIAHVLASPRHVRAGGFVTLRGTIAPHKPRLTLTIVRKLAPGRYVVVGRRALNGRRGKWDTTLQLLQPGLYRFDVSSPADRSNPAGHGQAFARARGKSAAGRGGVGVS